MRLLRGRRSGSALLEYVFVGIPSLFLTLSVFEVSLGMWQYHTMAEAAQIAARYVVTHGAACACAVTPANIATVVGNEAVGLSAANTNLTLKSASATITCTVQNCMNAVSVTCAGAGCPTAVFPPAADAAAGNNITVILTYNITNPLLMYWPGGVQMSTGSYTLGAQSVQEILY